MNGHRASRRVTSAKRNRSMSGDLTIRFVTRQDYAQWLPLWLGYNAFYGRSGATALSPEITAMTWARFFDAYEPAHALVAESDGELLGLTRSEEHTSELQSPDHLVCRLLLEKKKKKKS